MASEEIRKKWGTIFMGEREASVEQLNAMQEPLRKEREKKERTEDYMERVRARAADRAREILGAAYAERQKVLDEARAEIAARKRQAQAECGRLQQEGEQLRQQAQAEFDQARAVREEAEKIRLAAHDEGLQEGLEQAGAELHEFRAELGQSLAVLMRAIERERKNILENWRGEMAELVKCAVQAGTGLILQKEHETILRALVFQALNLLESRGAITMRVNPADEAAVSDMFHAARERAPELKQWIVTGDENIESGGLVAETSSGSVDLQRANFREMVDGVLDHLGFPDLEDEAGGATVRDLVEKEVAHIASLTPEMEITQEPAVAEEPQPEAPQIEEASPVQEEAEPAVEPAPDVEPPASEMPEEPLPEEESVEEAIEVASEEDAASMVAENGDPTLAELEEELFPLEEAGEPAAESPEPVEPTPKPEPVIEQADPETLAQGGFL